MNNTEFKTGFFRTPSQLHHHRLAISQKQLTEFWFNQPLIKLQQILSLHDQYLIHQIIFQQYLKYYLSCKKITAGEVYYVMLNDKIYLYMYDGKIFRTQQNQKYENDLISTFIIAYKQAQSTTNQQQKQQTQQKVQDNIYEFLNSEIIQPGKWLLKVKQSALLRIFPYLIHKLIGKRETSYTSTLRNPIGGSYLSKQANLPREVVILEQSSYSYYLYLILPKYHYSPEMSIKTLFDTLVDLMLNNLLLYWYSSLSQEQRYKRHFKQYFRLIPKPKNKQEFTSIQNRFTEISYQTFKILIFKLKYQIKQHPQHYQCYQIEDSTDDKIIQQAYEQLDIDDWHILKAFWKIKSLENDYQKEYHCFPDILQLEERFREEEGLQY